MKYGEISIIKTVLEQELGWLWLPFLIKCQLIEGRIFSGTNWSRMEGLETTFANRLSISSSIYLELLKKFDKDKAFNIMRNILVPIGTK